MNINNTLKDIIIEVSNRKINVSEINDTTILTSDLGFDSIQIVSLIVEIESKFKIELTDEDLNMDTLTEYRLLLQMIIAKLGEIK